MPMNKYERRSHTDYLRRAAQYRATLKKLPPRAVICGHDQYRRARWIELARQNLSSAGSVRRWARDRHTWKKEN